MPMTDLDPLARSLPADHFRIEIPEGVKGTAATIERMIKLINNGKRDGRLRTVVGQEVISKCPQKDYYCYAKAIHDYVCHKIKYAYDPVDVELIEDPMNIIQAGIADCDSKCILFCAMCEQVGLPCRLVTVKPSLMADEYTHVFSEVNIKGKWVSSDCTMPKEKFGWSPPDDMPRKVWPVSESARHLDDSNMVIGLGCSDCGGTCAKCNKGGDLLSELGMDGGKKMRRRQGRPAKRMRGMGALGDAGVVDTIQGVMNGTKADELQSAKIRADENLVYTYGVMSAAQQMGSEGQALADQASYAYEMAIAQKRAVQDAINQYSNLANTIQTYSLGAIRPRQLAEITTAIALAGIAAVATIAISASYAFGRAKDAEIAGGNSAKNLAAYVSSMKSAGLTSSEVSAALESLPTPPSGGGLTSSIGTVVLLGGLALLAVMFLKKRGTI